MCSEYLDEAMLMLKSEPLMRSHLGERVARLFRPDWRARPTTTWADEAGDWSQHGALLVRRVVQAASVAFSRALHLATWRVAESITMRILSKVIFGQLLGVGAEDLQGAQIEVSRMPGLPYLEATCVETSRQFSVDDHAMGRPAGRAERYEFLRDPEALRRRAAESDVVARMRREAQRGAGGVIFDEGLEEEERDRLALAFEEKARELRGVVSLEHGRYLEDEVVVATVARFISEDEPARRTLHEVDPLEVRENWGGGWRSRG